MATPLDTAIPADHRDSIAFVLFKDSEASFLHALNENNIGHQVMQATPGMARASGVVVMIAQSIITSGAVAAVLVAWLKARVSRKIIITTTELGVIHLEGYSVVEAQAVISIAKSAAIVDTTPQVSGAIERARS